MKVVEYVLKAVWDLPPCAECGMPATEGRHSSASPDEPCRGGFPAGRAGCSNPSTHHLYRLPSWALETRPVEPQPEWAR